MFIRCHTKRAGPQHFRPEFAVTSGRPDPAAHGLCRPATLGTSTQDGGGPCTERCAPHWDLKREQHSCAHRAEAPPPPSGEHPIKRPQGPRPAGKSLWSRAGAHTSPFCEQRIRFSFAFEQTPSLSTGSNDPGQKDPCWGPTRKGQ